MPLIKPQFTKPQVAGDLNVWGNKLNEIIDKQDSFNSKIVEDSNTQNGELSRLEQDKISKNELDGFVSNKVDNYINEYGKAIIDGYVDTVSKPDLNNYTDGKKSEINQYVENTSKPAINAFVDEEKVELNKYNDIKKTELDSHTVIKETQLNDYTIVKKTELDAHEKEKEKELDTFTGEKKVELTTHVNNEIKNVTAHADAKKIEIDTFTDEQKVELDSYEKSKEGELDTHTTKKKSELDTYTLSKNGELDTHTNKKKEELNAHEKLKEGELDSYNAIKKTELDSYEKVKEGELNDFTITKKTEITNHTNTEKANITSHTDAKKIEISEYTNTKKVELDTYEKEKETDLLLYTNNKKSELDTYTVAKKEDIDSHVVKNKKDLDTYVETTSKPAIQGFVNTKVEESNQAITTHTNAEIERLQGTGLGGKLDKGAYVGTAEDLNNEINKKATVQQLQEELQKIIGNSPETLDTLQEIATALGNDPNFATTITNLLSQKLEKGTYEGSASDLKTLIDALSATKQDKTDETLLTQAKVIVEAINEIKRKSDVLNTEKQDKIDNTLATESKTIVGGINELKGSKVDNTTYNLEVSGIRDSLATKPSKTTQVIAGKGLTGGGTLEGNVTLNIESTSKSLVVSENSIGLDLINDLVTGGVDRVPSAETIVVLNRKIDALEGGGSSSEIGQGENFGERRFKGVLEGSATDINLGTLIYHPELYLDGTRIAKEMYVTDLRTGHIKLNKVYSTYSVDYEIIDRYPFHIKFAYPTLNLLISQTQIKDSIKLDDVIKILGETTEDDGGARLVKCEDSKKLNGIDIGNGRFLNEVPESRIGVKLDKGGYSGNAQDLKNDIESKISKFGDTVNGDYTLERNLWGLRFREPLPTDSWARGNFYIENSNENATGGIGKAKLSGIDNFYMGFGTSPWEGLDGVRYIKGDNLYVKNNGVYHSGNKPTPNEIGSFSSIEQILTNIDLNKIVLSGVYKISANCTNMPIGANINGALFVCRNNNSDTMFQTYTEYESTKTWMRSANNVNQSGTSGNWYPWKRVLLDNDFPILKGETGWQKLPSGLIIQWGTSTTTNTYAGTTLSFPIAFSSSNYAITTNGVYGLENSYGVFLPVTIYERNIGSVRVTAGAKFRTSWEYNTNATYKFQWIAIGY